MRHFLVTFFAIIFNTLNISVIFYSLHLLSEIPLHSQNVLERPSLFININEDAHKFTKRLINTRIYRKFFSENCAKHYCFVENIVIIDKLF